MHADEPAIGEVERLVIAEKAASEAGESVARWWRQLIRSRDTATMPQSLDDLFREALGSIRRALGADTTSLLVADEDERELLARASVGLDDEIHPNLRIPAGQGMAGQVLSTRQPLIVDDLSAIELASPVLRERGLGSVVAVPLLAGERILGVLHAGSYQRRHFDTRDAEMLALVARRMAGAMERVWLLEIERIARHRAEELSDHLRRLQAVTSALARATDVRGVARTVSGTLGDEDRGGTPGAGAGGTADPAGAGPDPAPGDVAAPAWRRAALWVTVTTADGADGAVPAAPALSADDAAAEAPGDRCPPSVAAALRDGVPVVEEGPAASADGAGSGPANASAAVPVSVSGRVIGALEVAYGGSHRFSTEERELLSVVSEQVGQALDRARLLAEQERLVRTSGFLAEAARALAEAEGYRATLERLSELGLSALGDICLIDVVDDEGSLVRMVARHRERARQPLVDRLHAEYPPDPQGTHPALDVIRTGRSRWSPEMSDEFMAATTRGEQHLELTRLLGFRSYVSVPLRSSGPVLGALTLISAGRPFAPEDVTFVEALAQQVAAVVDGARRYESAFHTSRILQDHLLPRRSPAVPGVWAHARYLAATRGVEIGGDFYDAWEIAPGRVALMIGDVAGHDREAAAVMGQLRSAARALFSVLPGPSDVAAALSASWERMGFSRIATALFGVLEPASGALSLASAGHYPPLLVDDGAATYLPVPPSPPLGAEPRPPGADLWSGRLDDGAVLLLYTDGVLQERTLGIEEGMARLAVQATAGPADPRLLCQRVVAGLPASRSDDVALLAVARDDAPASSA